MGSQESQDITEWLNNNNRNQSASLQVSLQKKLLCMYVYLVCPRKEASSVQFSCSVMSSSLRPHESQHTRPPCPSPTPGVHSDSRPSSLWCHPAISSSAVPFSSCPQSLPASESFPMSQLFAWGKFRICQHHHLEPEPLTQSCKLCVLYKSRPAERSQWWGHHSWVGQLLSTTTGLHVIFFLPFLPNTPSHRVVVPLVQSLSWSASYILSLQLTSSSS